MSPARFLLHCVLIAKNPINSMGLHQLIIITSQLALKMSCLSIPEFSGLMQTISADSLYKKAVAEADRCYLVRSLGLQTLNPALAVQLIDRNFGKTNLSKNGLEEGEEPAHQTVWALNEFKLFVWVSVCYAFSKATHFQKFKAEDYEFLQSLFTRKSTTFLEYHLRNLLKEEKRARERWAEEEEAMLVKIIRADGFTFKWSEISFHLYEQSHKAYFRTPQKCREKWFNHLDPVVNRQKWTHQEDLMLFTSVLKFGTKWALISKVFSNSRTEHMTKNRFHSLVKKSQAKVGRTAPKKLIEKIQSDLYRQVHGVYPDKYLGELTNEELGEKEQELEEVRLEEKISTVSQTDEEKGPSRQSEAYERHLKKLRSFDIEQVLFSENTLKIRDPASMDEEVQLVEVELFAELPRGEEYFSLLF